ncbi:hypothetical protein OF829_16630 [Sphingomonas sp. LB-2]|uniref:hypothetical protein n=1 Tax=Sphingomonas caeni TaxID=2984949 RepID=UPI002230895E|nr:hypothetical protein [Sphingomonas caeni]MCW3848864.1 hypothetical protein [Sphingomonas caeni]
MTDGEDFPVELSADPDGGAGALRWTVLVLAITTLALALLNAEAIANWSHELSPSPGTAHVMAAADAWKDTTVRIGADTPHARLHRAWKRAEAMRWR